MKYKKVQIDVGGGGVEELNMNKLYFTNILNLKQYHQIKSSKSKYNKEHLPLVSVVP
jgi:hypothetical protein